MAKRIKIFPVMLLLGLLIILYGSNAFAREDINSAQKNMSLLKTTSDKYTRTICNIGNWTYWQDYTGLSAHDPFTDGSGGIYPRGTAGAIYLDGFIWGGIVDGVEDPQLRVGGYAYRIGTQAGWVQDDGTAVSPEDPRVRIYRIRADWKTVVAPQVVQDAAEQNNVAISGVTAAMTDAVIAQYKQDWKEWPTDLGAPYVDFDGDGTYNPVLDADGYADPMQGDYPGIANADQAIWYVTNDMNEAKVKYLYGSPSIGFELQTTIWAYNQPGASLGQIVFKKYKLINRSGHRIDSMYLAQWCDPDLGDYGDDLVGCDPALSVGYVYNGGPVDNEYAAFGLVPAAMGYDFFQGPILPSQGDTAVFDLKYVYDHKNLPMTTFGYFAAGGIYTDPTQGDYEGTKQWYNLLRGNVPNDDVLNPTRWTHLSGPNKGEETSFPLDGDPVTGEGDIDGTGDCLDPADRRMLQATGPFVMQDGDVQEIVVAVLGGLGDNYLTSITDMKNTDVVAQKLFDDLFATVPKPPPPPNVKAVPLEEVVVLNWGWDVEAVAETEKDNPLTGYNFEGYNVYQLPSATASLGDGELLATFDLVNGVTTVMGKRFVPEYGQVVEIPVQFGVDAGVQRFFHVDKDYIGGSRLYQGTTYYFAVTAYNYNAAPPLIEDKALESAPTVYSVTPQGTDPGVRYESEADDLLEITHEGPSDGQVQVRVVDPSAVTGHDYEVFFIEDIDTNSVTCGQIVWGLKDATDNLNKLELQVQVASFDDNSQLTADGLQVQVSGPAMGVKQVFETDAADNELDPRVSILKGSLGTTGYIISNRAGACNLPPYARDWDRFGYWGMDDMEIDFAASSLTWDYSSEAVHFKVSDGEPNYAPFAVYRHVFSTGERLRLFAGFWDTGDNATQNDPDGTWNMSLNADDTYRWVGPKYGAESYEPIFCWQGYDAAGNDISYDPANDAQYIADNSLLTSANTTWGNATGEFDYPLITAMLFTMYLDGATPPWGNKVWFVTNKPNTDQDIFSFSAPTVTEAQSLAKEDVEKISVFPNPYYSYNPLEPDRFSRFVTFTHIPVAQEVTIRLFNLAGVQVRKLDVPATNTSQFFRWNLQNETGLPVASGIYIAHIDMPDLGKTKVLKLMVIQAEEVLEYY